MKDIHCLADVLAHALEPDFIRTDYKGQELTLYVYTGSIVRSLIILRDHPDLLFKILLDICAVDYPEQEQRFEVVYHLLSVHHNKRLRVKVLTSDQSPIPTVTQVFRSANWYEREIWDLFGIPFTDHPDLRRLLTDYNFDGHPLRKDFPLTGYTEVYYSEDEKRVLYKPVSLAQEFRTFDFLSPWEGMIEKKTLSSSTSSQGEGNNMSDSSSLKERV